MNIHIYTVLIVLSVCIGNAASCFASNGNVRKVFIPNTLNATSISAKPHLAPFQLPARDDETIDCLRTGNCQR